MSNRTFPLCETNRFFFFFFFFLLLIILSKITGGEKGGSFATFVQKYRVWTFARYP